MPTSNAFKALVWLIALLPLLVFAVLYSRFPSTMVMQWDLYGNPTWHATRMDFGASLLIEILAIALVLHGRNSKKSAERFARIFPAIIVGIVMVISAVLIAAEIANLPH